MGKRSNFKRKPQDKYHTPPAALPALLRHLGGGSTFAEVCAGKGKLIDGLTAQGHFCAWASDIKPQRAGIRKRDALKLKRSDLPKHFGSFITNPPWTREIMHALIAHLLTFGKPVWMLFDADWAHNKQAVTSGLLDKCAMISSVGRVKWFPRSKYAGKDNVAWYYFHADHKGGPRFVGRVS